jgi:hypothetical protein
MDYSSLSDDQLKQMLGGAASAPAQGSASDYSSMSDEQLKQLLGGTAAPKATYAEDVQKLVSDPGKVAWEDVKRIPGDIADAAKAGVGRVASYASEPRNALADAISISRKMNPLMNLWDTAKGIVNDPEASARAVADPNRPVSSALNLATLGMGGGATVGRGALALGTKTALGADKLAQFPISALSGVSPDVMQLASKAGELGGKEGAAFTGQMRKTAAPGAPVETAQRAVDAKAAVKSEAYLANKANWDEAGKYLDIAPVEDAVNRGRAMTRMDDGLVFNAQGEAALDRIGDKVQAWKTHGVPANMPEAVAPAPTPGRTGRSYPALVSSPATRFFSPEGMPPVYPAGHTPPGLFDKLPEGSSGRRFAMNEPGVAVSTPRVDPSVTSALSSWVNTVPEPHGPKITGATPTSGVMGPQPSRANTIAGFDKLKQAIGEIVFDKNMAPENTAARKAAMGVYNSIKEEIGKQAPNYAKAMEQAQKHIEELHEIRSTLSLGEKKSVDQALAKLQSTLRNDVASRFGFRKKALLDELAKYEPTLPYELAGQSASAVLPRGLAKFAGTINAGTHAAVGAAHGGVMGGLGAMLTPAALIPLALSSPRLVNEARYGVGAATRGARKAGLTQKNAGISIEALRMLGQNRNQE